MSVNKHDFSDNWNPQNSYWVCLCVAFTINMFMFWYWILVIKIPPQQIISLELLIHYNRIYWYMPGTQIYYIYNYRILCVAVHATSSASTRTCIYIKKREQSCVNHSTYHHWNGGHRRSLYLEAKGWRWFLRREGEAERGGMRVCCSSPQQHKQPEGHCRYPQEGSGMVVEKREQDKKAVFFLKCTCTQYVLVYELLYSISLYKIDTHIKYIYTYNNSYWLRCVGCILFCERANFMGCVSEWEDIGRAWMCTCSSNFINKHECREYLSLSSYTLLCHHYGEGGSSSIDLSIP